MKIGVDELTFVMQQLAHLPEHAMVADLSIVRGLDYYTGFEFELHHKGNGTEPLVAGGRYDGLMTQLGSATPIPAVGFSVWIEALTQLGSRGSAA